MRTTKQNNKDFPLLFIVFETKKKRLCWDRKLLRFRTIQDHFFLLLANRHRNKETDSRERSSDIKINFLVPFYFLLVSFSTQYGRHCLWEWYLAGSYTFFFLPILCGFIAKQSIGWMNKSCQLASTLLLCYFPFPSFNLLNVQSLGDFDRLVILGRPLPSEYLKSRNRKLSFHFLTTVLSKWFY